MGAAGVMAGAAAVSALAGAYSASQAGKKPGSSAVAQQPFSQENTVPQPPYMQQPGTMGNQGYLEELMKLLRQGR